MSSEVEISTQLREFSMRDLSAESPAHLRGGVLIGGFTVLLIHKVMSMYDEILKTMSIVPHPGDRNWRSVPTILFYSLSGGYRNPAQLSPNGAWDESADVDGPLRLSGPRRTSR